LQLSDRNADLIEERIDVALRIGALPDSALTATRIGALRRIVCGAPAYFEQYGEPATPEDLAAQAQACVNFDAPPGGDLWGFGRDGRNTVRPSARLSVNNAEAALDAAIAGVGLTRVLSYQAAAAITAGRLRVTLARFEPEPLPVHLLYGEREPLPLKLRSFLDFAAPRLRRRLAEVHAAF